MRERRSVIVHFGQSAVHQPRRVLLARHRWLIQPCPAFLGTGQESLAVQVVHHRHYGRIRQRTGGRQRLQHLPHGGGLTAPPHQVHDDRFQIAEAVHNPPSPRAWMAAAYAAAPIP